MKSRTLISRLLCIVYLLTVIASLFIFDSKQVNAGYTKDNIQAVLKNEDGSVNTETDIWKIWSILRSNGISEAAAAGIMGNLNQESTFNPADSNGSYTGIAQWDNENRFPALQKWCQENGKNAETIEGQTEFLIYEAPSMFNSNLTWEKFKSINGDVDGATEAFCVLFESCTGGEQLTSQLMKDYWGTDWASHPYQELTNRREVASAIYTAYTGLEVTHYEAVSGYSGDSSSSTALQSNGSLMSMLDLDVTVTNWYDNAISLPTADGLEITDKAKIANWKDDVESNTDFSVIKWLRAVVAFVGIIISVYCIFIYLAYWFDRVNNFIDISALSILTFGKLAISPDDTTSTFNPETKGTKVVVHRDMIFICLLGIAFGVILLSGKIYTFIYWLLSWVKKVVN